MDRDQSSKLNETILAIKTALNGIKTAVDTIAVNTTPADSQDAEPTANTETRSAKK